MARVFVSSRFDEFATLRRASSRGVATTSAVEMVNLDDGKAAPMGAVETLLSSLNAPGQDHRPNRRFPVLPDRVAHIRQEAPLFGPAPTIQAVA